MRKIVNIDGKDVKLVSNGATPILYKQEFGTDFFADLVKLIKSSDSTELTELSYEQLNHMDLTVFYRIIYIFARSGNNDINSMVDWLEEFDEFPIFDYLEEIMEMVQQLLSREKKGQGLKQKAMNSSQ